MDIFFPFLSSLAFLSFLAILVFLSFRIFRSNLYLSHLSPFIAFSLSFLKAKKGFPALDTKCPQIPWTLNYGNFMIPFYSARYFLIADVYDACLYSWNLGRPTTEWYNDMKPSVRRCLAFIQKAVISSWFEYTICKRYSPTL